MKGVLVTAVVCLAVGLGVLWGFCSGTAGMQFAYPLSGASVHVDITTQGAPAVAGFGLTALGAFLLIVATVIALVGMRRGHVEGRALKRRGTAFEE